MRLPKSVLEIAEIIGNERALYLVGKLPRCWAGLPGKESSRVILYVPTLARMKPNHELVKIMGWHDAQRLAREFGGEILQLANCAEIYRGFRDCSILRLVNDHGMKPGDVAQLMGVSDRHVRNLLRENPQKDKEATNDNTPTK